MMTLEQKTRVAKAIHEGLRRNGTVVMYSAAFERIVADAIDAHLAQQPKDAQPVDVAAIRGLIDELEEDSRQQFNQVNREYGRHLRDKLTRAIGGAK